MDTNAITHRTLPYFRSSPFARLGWSLGLAVGLVACGGGGSGEETSAPLTPPPIIEDPDTFYLADQDTDGVFELYASLTASPGASTKLSGDLSLPGSETGNVSEHLLAPDDDTVIFLADKDTANARELYSASLSNPGTTTKISGPLSSGQTITRGFQLSPDGQRLVYRISSNSGAAELYQVRLDTPGVATRLNGPLVSGGNVKRTTVRSLSLL